MKILVQYMTLTLLVIWYTAALAQNKSETRAVRAYATVNKTTPAITLHWPAQATVTWSATTQVVDINIYRRALTSDVWGTPIATLTAADSTYTDANITLGQSYEYAIKRSTDRRDPLRNDGANIAGYAYLAAGIEVAPIHERGILWVLITPLLADSLESEIDQLLIDLAADGWDVYTQTVSDTATVADVKSLLENKRISVGCDAVYLLGNIAVPYAGQYCLDTQYPSPPDGHGSQDPNSHCGAWPADVYYGTTSGVWTDDATNDIGVRPENVNLPGDGKFDESRIPGEVTIGVGRVDMSRLPAFGVGEVQLTRRYLNKVHQYKMGMVTLENKGVIENNFSGLDEGFSSAALRDFSAICGNDGIVLADVLTANRTANYKFSYACGAGSYTSCGGFGNTNSLVNDHMGAFNHLFGSFFGDWDIQNNILRATLATQKLGYTTVWSGRPKWATHTLATGESHAKMALRSQNNFQNYDGNSFQNGTHMALLGDPSLRIDALSPASSIVLEANEDSTAVSLSWTMSMDVDVDGYFVYRSHKGTGKYILLTPTPISTLSYTDESPYDGTNFYMVKATKETETGSGSYMNLSLGIVAEINGMSGTAARVFPRADVAIKLYPTLASSDITLETSARKTIDYRVLDQMGRTMMTGTTQGMKTTLNIQQLSSGIYYLRIGGSSAKFMKR